MKPIYSYLLWIPLIIFFSIPAWADLSTEHGETLPASGTLRVLVIFAELDCSLCADTLHGCGNNHGFWPAGTLPRSASNIDSFKHHWFDPDLPAGVHPTPGNITDYYYQASMGNYRVFGDYYPELITVPCSLAQANEQAFAVFDALNAHTLSTGGFISAQGYELGDFDLWLGADPGMEKTAGNDGVIDAIQIVWRNIAPIDGGNGMSSPAAPNQVIFHSGFEAGDSGFIYHNGDANTQCYASIQDPSEGAYHGRCVDISNDPANNGQYKGAIITADPFDFKENRLYQVGLRAKVLQCPGKLQIMKSSTPTHNAMLNASGNDVVYTSINNNVTNIPGYTTVTTPFFEVFADEGKYLGFHLSHDGAAGCMGAGMDIDRVVITEFVRLNQTPTFSYKIKVRGRLQSKDGDQGLFINEYFHALFGGNHWHTGNGVGAITFLTYPQNFSMTSYAQVGAIPCGWDRQHLGWKGWQDMGQTQRKNHLVSAPDANTGNEADLGQFSLSTHANGGQYILRDHITYGDAIRIILPMGQPWQALGDVKNQYLWIENHQKLSRYDQTPDEHKPCREPWSKGLYSYVQVGKDQKDTSLIGEIFSSDVDHPNGLGSFLFPLTAEGNYDLHYRFDLAGICDPEEDCCYGNAHIPIDPILSQTRPNPFTGHSDLYNITLLPGTNSIPRIQDGGNYQYGWTSEMVNGAVQFSQYAAGDADDAFRCNGCTAPQKILSIATNPAPVPVYTYTSNVPGTGFSAGYPENLDSYENRTIYLNGLSVSILEEGVDPAQYGPGAVKIEVRWDDFTVDRYTRWCGNIVQRLNPFDFFQPSLIIDTGAEVHLDRGLSPVRHAPLANNASLTDPTVLTINPNAITENRGTLTIDNGSTLELTPASAFISKPGSEVNLFRTSKININNQSSFTLDSANLSLSNSIVSIKAGGLLRLLDNSTITVKSGSELVIEDGAVLHLYPHAKILVEPDGILVIENKDNYNGFHVMNVNNLADRPEIMIGGKVVTRDDVNWVIDNRSLLSFYQNALVELGTNSKLIMGGQGRAVTMMKLNHDARVAIEGSVHLENGSIKYDHGADLIINNGDAFIQRVNFQGITSFSSNALIAENLDDLVVDDCLFDFQGTGLTLRNFPLNPSAAIIQIKNNVFTNCHVAISISGSSRTLGISNNILTGSGNGIGILSKLSDAVHINNCAISQFELGMDLEDGYAFYVAGSTIDHCEKGIRANNASVFLRDHTVIKNCRNAGGTGAGVEMHGTAPYFSLLSVGDKGCGFITGNDIGVAGTDFELAIDAELHACNRGKCPQLIPNRFDGNDRIFDIVYKWLSPVSIEAKSNFWGENGGGTGQPLNSFNYSIVAQVGKQVVPVQVHAQNHIPTKPTTCFCVGINCPRPGGGTGGGNGLGSRQLRQLIECRSPAPQTSTSIGNEYELAYDDFLAEDYHPARARFSSLGELDLQPGKGKPFDAVCQHTIRVSRVLARVAAMHAGMDNTTTTAKVKGYVTDADTTSMHRELFTIHPNPSDGRFTVDLAAEGNYLLQVFDLLGKEQYRDFVAQSGAIDLGHLEQGVYMVAVLELNGSRSANNKVVVY